MKISRRSFAKIMASTLMSTLAGCSDIFPTHRPSPEKPVQSLPNDDILPSAEALSQIIPRSEMLPRLLPWFRSYENSDIKLSADDNHMMEFSHWLENSLILDGKKTSFSYAKKNHYQIGNRGPAIISDAYYVYEIEKIYSLLQTTQPYWPDDVSDVVKKIKSGEVKINRGVIHWHRHHEKLKFPSKFKLTETYYMIVYVESQDMAIPALEITHNSVAKYQRDSLSFDVERIFAKAESTDGLFRAPDSAVVHWQELPETIGISRKNIFWVAADLEASNSTQKIHYFCDGPDPCLPSNQDLFLLYSPDQPAGNVLTQYMNVISTRAESGLTTFTAETINGSNHYRYFHRDNGWTPVDVGNSGITMPIDDGAAFNKFLEFLTASIPGMVSYLGGGKFSVTTEPQGSLVAENGTRNSPMVGIGVIALDIMKIMGGPTTAVASGVSTAKAVANSGDFKREKYRESPENQAKISALNQAGYQCGLVTHPGKSAEPLSAQRMSECRECLSSSEAYDAVADGAVNRFLSGESTKAVGAPQTVTIFADYAENEAYIDSIENGAISGCSTLT